MQLIEYLSGIKLKYKKDIHKCKTNHCYYLKQNILQEIETCVEEINYMDKNEININYLDYEHAKIETCYYCNNKIKYFYNPVEIYNKYAKRY